MRPLVSSNYTGTPNYPELIGARIVSVIYSVGFLFTNVDASFFFLLSFFLPSFFLSSFSFCSNRTNSEREKKYTEERIDQFERIVGEERGHD